jgi:hypothetical protein
MKFCLLIFGLLQSMIAVAALPSTGTDWSDRKEYDLVLNIRSESSPQKRLALLDSWTKTYPKTGLSRARQELYLNTYEALGDHAHMFDIARQILAARSDDPVGLYWVTVLAPQQSNPGPDVLDAANNAAHRLLASVATYFAPDKRPSSVSDADWQKQKLNVEVIANRTIGWTSWQRNDLAVAEENLSACLKKDPGDAEISSWLGIVYAIDTNKQPTALWHLARATNKGLSSPLAEEQRRQVNSMLESIYASYHGSLDGLDELRKIAAANPLPPAEFSIDAATVVNARKAELQLSLTNPELASWMAMRRQLEAQDGQQYFSSVVLDKPLPKLRGTVLGATPPRSPREITLSMTDASTPDVTLKLAAPLPRAVPPGTTLSFQGTGVSFTKAPFVLVVSADTAQAEGKQIKTP